MGALLGLWLEEGAAVPPPTAELQRQLQHPTWLQTSGEGPGFGPAEGTTPHSGDCQHRPELRQLSGNLS